jgi:hypothetical protein
MDNKANKITQQTDDNGPQRSFLIRMIAKRRSGCERKCYSNDVIENDVIELETKPVALSAKERRI